MRVLGISWAGVVAEDFVDAVRFFSERTRPLNHSFKNADPRDFFNSLG